MQMYGNKQIFKLEMTIIIMVLIYKRGFLNFYAIIQVLTLIILKKDHLYCFFSYLLQIQLSTHL